MEKFSVLFYLIIAAVLLSFLAYAVFYYRKAKNYEAEIGVIIPSWIKGVFILLASISVLLILAICVWLVVWTINQIASV